MKKYVFTILFICSNLFYMSFSCGRVSTMKSYKVYCDSNQMAEFIKLNYPLEILPLEHRYYLDTLKLNLNHLNIVPIYLKDKKISLVTEFSVEILKKNVRYVSLSLRAIVKKTSKYNYLGYNDRSEISEEERLVYESIFYNIIKQTRFKFEIEPTS